MRIRMLASALLVLPALLPQTAIADPAAAGTERGRFLVQFGGCNDCHTPGYAEKGGAMPEQEWLTGSPVGFQGPWGTTYPGNLRLDAANWTEEQWIAAARVPRMPPMPWFNLKLLADDDLRAMYRYIRGLGPAGEPAPLYVAPGEAVTTPYISFEPRVDPPQLAGK